MNETYERTVLPCVENIEISEPPRKRIDLDPESSRSGIGSCFGLSSSSKNRYRKNTARKSVTHVTNNNADGFRIHNSEANEDASKDESDFTDNSQRSDEINSDDEHLRRQYSNPSEIDFSSESDDEPYSPTTREKRLQYSMDKDYRPDDEDQSNRILTDVESIYELLQKALKHECRPKNNFGTRKQSVPLTTKPVIEIHHKQNPETKGINLELVCKTCNERVYNNSSMVNEKFLIKNTAVWISLLFGQSYREAQAVFSMLGLPFYKDPGTFYSHRRKIAEQIAATKSQLFKKYRKRAFNHPKNRDNFVTINGVKRRKLEVVSLDGSWNTRGWHAFDCIMYVIDPNSKGRLTKQFV